MAPATTSISGNGVLVYWGGFSFGENQLGWYDRAGKPLGNVGAPARTTEFALAPDEKMVVAPRRTGSGNNSDIWLHELARSLDTRFTFHASWNFNPVWSPDGRRILFASAPLWSSTPVSEVEHEIRNGNPDLQGILEGAEAGPPPDR